MRVYSVAINLVCRNPRDGFGIGPRHGLTTRDMADIVHDYEVVPDAPIGIAMDAIEALDDRAGLDVETGLFPDFPLQRIHE